jgi:hypothetical protein
MFRIFCFCYLVLFVPLVYASPFNLHDDVSLVYASESLSDADFNSSGYLLISNASDLLNLEVKSGFGISSDARYIRVDVINGAFNDTFSVAGLAASTFFTSSLAAGGSVGDNYIIVEVTASPAVGADTVFTLQSTSFQWFDSAQPLKARYSLYDTAAAAVNQSSFLVQLTKDIATLDKAIGSKYTRSFTHKVGFSQDFLRFNPTFRLPSTYSLGDSSETLASVGKVLFEQLILGDALLASTSLSITDFRDLIPGSDTSANTSTIYGDFSSVDAFLNANDNCTGASFPLLSYSDIGSVSVSIDNLLAFPVFCLQSLSNEVEIRRATYELELGEGYDKSLLGEITYDAASVDIPYLTNFENYRQKVYLVNHAGYDIGYISRFIAEEAVSGNYVAGDGAQGVLKANSTLVLKSTDIVSIEEDVPTRISVRIFMDAKPEDVSAAVQILSIESQAAPTTNFLDVMKH